ncbi:UNVERIFIED_CONTAM: hypothetical protein H355_012533, partial [Colinus virginianus]
RILDWHKQQDKLNGAPATNYEGDEDPGVQRVKRVYRYFKRHDVKTVVMAASFRNIGEVISLAGCDKVTVSPALLAELDACSGSIVTRRLGVDAEGGGAGGSSEEAAVAAAEGEGAASAEKTAAGDTENSATLSPPVNKVSEKGAPDGTAAGSHSGLDDQDEASISLDEKSFRWALNEDPMATEKLAEGIRLFNKDLLALKRLVAEKIAESNALQQKTEATPTAQVENVETDMVVASSDPSEATAGTQNDSPEAPAATA